MIWKGRKFRGRSRPTPGSMNKTEQAFAHELEMSLKAGLIEWWGHEPIKLRLAPNTFYTPDFAVLYPQGGLTFYEVKGFWEDDARVKIKVAAEKFWYFSFIAVRKRKGGFEEELIGPDADEPLGLQGRLV